MEDVKLKFIVDILQPKLDKLWEIVTIKEFLLDQSSNDEILFYLHCRYLLFRGG
jgi:hypothetical protein